MKKKHAKVVEKYLAEFEAIGNSGDTEEIHIEADRILLSALRELGFGELSDAFVKASRNCGGFWYA